MNITREDTRFWDVRTIDRRIRRGLLTRKDYDKHLKALEDAQEKVSLQAEASDDDDLDDDAFDDEDDDEPEAADPSKDGVA